MDFIHKPTKPLFGFILLAILGFTWGTGYSIARFAMTNGVSPFAYSFWQACGPALIMAMIALPKTPKAALTVSAFRFYLICGLTGIVIPNTSMYFAAPHLPAGILAMIVNIVPIFAYPIALLARLEQFNWQRLIGILLAFSGLLWILLPSSSLPLPSMIPWVLSTLITPLSFAICSIYIARNRPQHINSLTLAAGMLVAATLLLTPMVFFTKSFYYFHFPLTSPDEIIILEILLSSLGYFLFFQLIKLAGPVYYSLVDTIVVITGLFWGRIIFDERLNEWTSIALCLIVTALLLVTQEQRKQVILRENT